MTADLRIKKKEPTWEELLDRDDRRNRAPLPATTNTFDNTNRADLKQRKIVDLQKEFEELKDKIKHVETKNGRMLTHLRTHNPGEELAVDNPFGSPPLGDRGSPRRNNYSKGTLSREKLFPQPLRNQKSINQRSESPAGSSLFDAQSKQRVEFTFLKGISETSGQLKKKQEEFQRLVESKLRWLGEKIARAEQLTRMCNDFMDLRDNSTDDREGAYVLGVKARQLQNIIAEMERDQAKLKEHNEEQRREMDEQRTKHHAQKKYYQQEIEGLYESMKRKLADAETKYQNCLLRHTQDLETVRKDYGITSVESSLISGGEGKMSKDNQLEMLRLDCNHLQQINASLKGDLDNEKQRTLAVIAERDKAQLELKKRQLSDSLEDYTEQISNLKTTNANLKKELEEIAKQKEELEGQLNVSRRESKEFLLKNVKKDQFRTELEELYKGKLRDESQVLNSVREAKKKLEAENIQLKATQKSLSKSDERFNAQVSDCVKRLTQIGKDTVMQSLAHTYSASPRTLIVEILKALVHKKLVEMQHRRTMVERGILQDTSHSEGVNVEFIVIDNLWEQAQRMRQNGEEAAESFKQKEAEWLQQKGALEAINSKYKATVTDLKNKEQSESRLKISQLAAEQGEETLRFKELKETVLKAESAKREAETKSKIQQNELQDLAQSLKSMILKKDKLQQEIKELSRQHQQEIRLKNEEYDALMSLNKEIKEEQGRKRKETTAEIKTIQQELQQVAGELQKAKGEIKEKELVLGSREEELRKRREDIKKVQAEKEELEKLNKQIGRENQVKEDEVSKVEENLNFKENNLKAKEVAILERKEQVQAQVMKNQEQKVRLQAQEVHLREKQGRLKEKDDQLRQKEESLRGMSVRKEAQMVRLQEQADQIKEKEERLRETKESLDRMTMRNEAEEVRLNIQADELKDKDNQLIQSENQLREKVQRLKEKETSLDSKQAQLRENEESLGETNSRNEKEKARLLVQKEELREREDELRQKEVSNQERGAELISKETSLREISFNNQEEKVRLKALDAQLKQKESEFNEKKDGIMDKKESLSKITARNEEDKAKIQVQEQQMMHREESLSQKANHLQEKEQSLSEMIFKNDNEKVRLQAHQQGLKEKEKQLIEKEKKLIEEEDQLKRKQEVLIQSEDELREKDEVLREMATKDQEVKVMLQAQANQLRRKQEELREKENSLGGLFNKNEQEESRLQVQEERLREKEEVINNVEERLRNKEEQLKKKEQSLDQITFKHEEETGRIQAKEEKLREKEDQLRKKESQLEEIQETINSVTAKSEEERVRIQTKEKILRQKEEGIHLNEENLLEMTIKNEKEKSSLEVQVETLREKEQEIRDKEQEIREKDVQLKQKEESLSAVAVKNDEQKVRIQAQMEELVKKEERLSYKEEHLSEQEQQLRSREEILKVKEGNLEEMIFKNESEKVILKAGEEELKEKEKGLRQMSLKNEEEKMRLEALKDQLTQQEDRLSSKESQLREKNESLSEMADRNEEKKAHLLDLTKQQLTAATDSLQKSTQELGHLNEKKKVLETQIQELRIRDEEKQREMGRVIAKLEELSFLLADRQEEARKTKETAQVTVNKIQNNLLAESQKNLRVLQEHQSLKGKYKQLEAIEKRLRRDLDEVREEAESDRQKHERMKIDNMADMEENVRTIQNLKREIEKVKKEKEGDVVRRSEQEMVYLQELKAKELALQEREQQIQSQLARNQDEEFKLQVLMEELKQKQEGLTEKDDLLREKERSLEDMATKNVEEQTRLQTYQEELKENVQELKVREDQLKEKYNYLKKQEENLEAKEQQLIPAVTPQDLQLAPPSTPIQHSKSSNLPSPSNPVLNPTQQLQLPHRMKSRFSLEDYDNTSNFEIGEVQKNVENSSNSLLVEFFFRLKAEIQRVLLGEEVSVEIFEFIPTEIENELQDLLTFISEKVRGHQLSYILVNQFNGDTILGDSILDDFPGLHNEEVISLQKKVVEQEKIITNLTSEKVHQEQTINQITQEMEEMEEENEGRFITQLSVLKQELKEVKVRSDQLEITNAASKKTLFNVLEILVSDDAGLEEDLAQALNYYNEVAKATQKEKKQLEKYFDRYAAKVQ